MKSLIPVSPILRAPSVRTAIAVLAVMLNAWWVLANVAQAGMVHEHKGALNPSSAESWTSGGGGGIRQAIPSDVGYNYLPAWKVADPGGGSNPQYQLNLAAGDLSDAKSQGWKLTVKVRVDGAGYNTGGAVANHAMQTEFSGKPSDFNGRWLMRFGSDDSGSNALVDMWQSTGTFSVPGNGYHQYDLIDPDGGGAPNLYVDGSLIASGIARTDTYAVGRLNFGDNNGVPAGNANYNYVGFETGASLTPTPLPSGLLPLISLSGKTTLHDDNFERAAVDSNPYGGVPGTWNISENNAANVAVFGPASGGPGAPEGDQYLKLGSTGSLHTASALMRFEAVDSGVIRAHHMLYLTENATNNGTINLNFTDGGAGFGHKATWVGILNPNNPYVGASGAAAGQGVLAYHTGSGWNNVTTSGQNMFLDYGSWHDIWTTLNLDTDMYTLTVDGIASDPMAGFDVSVAGYQVFNNGAGTQQFFIDAVRVPEPSTLALLMLGVLGIAWRRRR